MVPICSGSVGPSHCSPSALASLVEMLEVKLDATKDSRIMIDSSTSQPA